MCLVVHRSIVVVVVVTVVVVVIIVVVCHGVTVAMQATIMSVCFQFPLDLDIQRRLGRFERRG